MADPEVRAAVGYMTSTFKIHALNPEEPDMWVDSVSDALYSWNVRHLGSRLPGQIGGSYQDPNWGRVNTTLEASFCLDSDQTITPECPGDPQPNQTLWKG